ncbi:MAG TPA: hypothetical protein VGV57_13895 [Thermoleophilaceae bacterium]|nr:hypothetical protein [Thermoleophilaceae bacterium]
MARPTKLTSEVSERIVRAIRAGNYPEVAAGHAGIHAATYYRWMERGALEGEAGEDDPYRQFRSEVERAIADSEAAEVGLVIKAARDGDWRAAAWLLERRFSDRWGRRDRLEQLHELKEADEAGELDREIERLLEEMAGRERD